MHYISLLLTVAKKLVCAPVAHKIYFIMADCIVGGGGGGGAWGIFHDVEKRVVE